MTDAEYRKEFDHEYQTRLGLMAGNGDPSPEQKEIAFEIADKHEQKLREQNNERPR